MVLVRLIQEWSGLKALSMGKRTKEVQSNLIRITPLLCTSCDVSKFWSVLAAPQQHFPLRMKLDRTSFPYLIIQRAFNRLHSCIEQTSTNGGSDHTYPMVMSIEIIFLTAHNRVEYDSNI